MRRGPVLVAGGGAAGIGAALRLARSGEKVILLEARSRLGGRAFSFPCPSLGGVEVDNGPHVLVGAYGEFRALLRELGREGDFLHAPSLDLSFLGPQGRIHRIAAPPYLPAPLHLAAALLGYRALTPVERFRTALAVGRLLRDRRRGRPLEGTVADWLRRARLQGGPARFLLGPLCRAVLNTREEEASLALFAAALAETFLGAPARAALWIPRLPWSRILGRPALAKLRSLGVEVRLGCRLQGMEIQGGRFRRALTSRGPLEGRALLLCLPPWEARRVLPSQAGPFPWAGLEGSSLETLYLLPREGRFPGGPPVVGFSSPRPFDFLVRREDGLWAFLATPAPSRSAREKPEETARKALASLGIPPSDQGEIRAVRVFWKEAVLHQPAGVEALRPGPKTALPGVFLGGDWIDTGLPATLESGARSARAAVRAFLEDSGEERKLPEESER